MNKPHEQPMPPTPASGGQRNQAILLDLSSGPTAVLNRRTAADIVFVIDTTGSMSDKIEGLLQTCRKLVDDLANKTVDWRIAIVSFGDLTILGDKIEATGFSGDVNFVRKALASVPRNDGGGNEGESSLEALIKALRLQGYRRESIKVFILVTDEPALQRQLSVEVVVGSLLRATVVTFVISPPLSYFKEMAKRTGGAWFMVAAGTDFTSILRMFDQVTERVANTIQRIQVEAGGDVGRFLRLSGPNT